MYSKNLEAYKKNLILTKTQRDLIIGMLLGDGHLESQDKGRTYRLKVEHSIVQKNYVDWLYKEFSKWTGQPPKERIKNSFGKEKASYGFNTYSSGSLRFYGQQFYQGNKKVIPKLIKKLLSPLAIAVWFMDDGSFKSTHHRTYIIHTLGYAKDELEIIREAFIKFGITIGIHKQYNKWRIYIYSDSAQAFKQLIEPYIIPSMRYKLGNEFVSPDRRNKLGNEFVSPDRRYKLG